MALARALEIYMREIKPLPTAERLKLLALIADDLATEQASAGPRRNLMELHGLGKEIWEGVDPDEYVRTLRREWEHRP